MLERRRIQTMLLQRLSLLTVLMCSRPKSGHSKLITFPRDTEVLVNQSTHFNCSTSILSEQIHWYHFRVGENQTNYVYYKGQFNQIYAERYSIEINTKTGEYNLIIRSVQAGDAGRYLCQDDGGLGNLGSAELIVLESTPTCLSIMKPDGFVGPNSCDLPSEKLKFSCSVSFNGNIPPILQWKMSGNDDPILEGVATNYSGKRATVNLTMSSTVEMNGVVFTCDTTRSQDKQLTCSTNPVKINYAVGQPANLNIAKGENLTCLSNSTVPCTYKWFYDNDTLCPASCSQNLTTHRLGEHSCEASCPINGISCTFIAIRILVFEEEPSTASEESTKALLIAIGLLVPTVVVLLITTCILFFKLIIARKAKSENTELKNKTSVGLLIETNLQSSTERQPAAVEENTGVSESSVYPSKDDEVEKQLFLGTEETNIEETVITTKTSEEMSGAIAGVAALEDLIYVVCDNSPEVETFDAVTLHFKNRSTLKELVNPWDLASCNLFNCLYIMDLRSINAKYLIRVDSNGKILSQWSTGYEYGNLSVASDGNVIITVCDNSRLFIYSPDGRGSKVVSLSEDTIHPSHALEMKNGQFLICHGTDKDNIHRVCILNGNGEIIKSSLEKMKSPSYLAIDDDGWIFVVDQGNSRVCVLNSDLKLRLEVASKRYGLPCPQRICLNVRPGKVLIVDNNSSEFRSQNGTLSIDTYDL